MKPVSDIKLIRQPTADTCTSACIAMITGQDINFVISQFHEQFCKDEINIYDYFSHWEFSPTFHYAGDRKLIWGNLYMLCVPALNARAFHSIVADLRDGENIKIFDPNQGKTNKLFYTKDDSLLDHLHCAEKLEAFSIDISFQPSNNTQKLTGEIPCKK